MNAEIEAAQKRIEVNKYNAARREHSKTVELSQYLNRNNANTKYSELVKAYPELGETSKMMELLKNEKVNGDYFLRDELLDEMTKALKVKDNVSLRNELSSMLKEDLAKELRRTDFSGGIHRVSQDIESIATMGKDNTAFAKELKDSLKLTNNSSLRETYMYGLGQYGKKNPSDLSFVDVIKESMNDTVGNSGFAKKQAYSSLAEFDGQYNSLKEVLLSGTGSNYHNVVPSVIKSAKTPADKQDFAKYVIERCSKEDGDDIRSLVCQIVNHAKMENNSRKWLGLDVLRPIIDSGKYKETSLHKDLISALS